MRSLSRQRACAAICEAEHLMSRDISNSVQQFRCGETILESVLNDSEEVNKYSVSAVEETLRNHGVLVTDRHPLVLPGSPGRYMAYDPRTVGDFETLLGDDRKELVFLAFKHLCESMGPLEVVEISDDELATNDYGISVELIGSVKTDSGTDQYVLLKRSDGEHLSPQFAERWMLIRVFREGGGPGSAFCHNVVAIQKPFNETSCVCIIEHRLDI